MYNDLPSCLHAHSPLVYVHSIVSTLDTKSRSYVCDDRPALQVSTQDSPSTVDVTPRSLLFP
jgi:hypothetical protein